MVVIAIVAILAAMLLPALSKAREKARAITCLNCEKSIGHMFMLYGDDHGGFYPAYYCYAYAPSSGDKKYWYDIAVNYLPTVGTSTEWKGWEALTARPYGATKKLAGSLSCPSASEEKVWRMDYGMNCFLASAAYDDTADGASKFKAYPVFNLTQPSAYMFFGETFDAGLGEDNETAATNPARYRHNKGMNLLYLDLHAEFHPNKLIGRPTSTQKAPRQLWMPAK